MWKHQPTSADLALFLRHAARGGNTPGNAWITRHLLADCPECRRSLAAGDWEAYRLDRLLGLPRGVAAETGRDYGPAFAAAERSLAAFLAPEPPPEEPAESLLAELAGADDEEQLRRVAEDRSYAAPAVVRALIERSHALRYEDPQRMLGFAQLARLAAEATDAAAAGSPARLSDLRARGWMQYGNSLRVCGRLQEADEALATAQRLAQAGTRDPLLRARLLEQTASLRNLQGRFPNAAELAEEAGRIYRELGERHGEGSTMVQRAITLLHAGETESAVRLLNRAIPKIDPEENPHLLLAACHNLIRCYLDLGQPEQALSLYFEARELYREFDDAVIRLKSGWQEGQLLRDLGHLRAAEATLLEARQGFLECGLAVDSVLVSLDLAAVYVKMHRFQEMRNTVAEAEPIIRALGVSRVAFGYSLQLQEADQEHTALELIQALSRTLAPLAHRS